MPVSDRLATILGARLPTGNRNTRDSLLVIVSKAKTLGVGTQDLNVGQLEVHPVLAVEDLGAVLGLSNCAGAVAVQTSTETSEAHTNVDGGQVGLLGSGLRRVFAEALIEWLLVLFSIESWTCLTNLLQGLRAAKRVTSEHDCNELGGNGGKRETRNLGASRGAEEIGLHMRKRTASDLFSNDAITDPCITTYIDQCSR